MLIPAVRARKALETGDVADLDEAVDWWRPRGSPLGPALGQFFLWKKWGKNQKTWRFNGEMGGNDGIESILELANLCKFEIYILIF